jgi:hypothetical protein
MMYVVLKDVKVLVVYECKTSMGVSDGWKVCVIAKGGKMEE